MSKFYLAPITDRRVFGGLVRLQVECPPLAMQVRPGQALLIRCSDPGSDDPLLRRAIYCAGNDQADGMLTLLISDDERGRGWLARQHPGATLDIFGPVGRPFELEARTGNLLLVGAGNGLAALVALAQQAVARRLSVVLLAAAPSDDLLLPPFLLPSEVEYQSTTGNLLDLIDQQPGDRRLPANIAASPILWADQICAALPSEALRPFAEVLRIRRLRWSRDFAHVLLPGELPCGNGACLGCLVETRKGWRTRCKDGPVFDLRSLVV